METKTETPPLQGGNDIEYLYTYQEFPLTVSIHWNLTLFAANCYIYTICYKVLSLHCLLVTGTFTLLYLHCLL